MNIKRVLLLLLIIPFLCGCENVSNLSYDSILNYFNESSKLANTYGEGYSYYIPVGVSLMESGSQYSILEDEYNTYYMYFDLISYINDVEIEYEADNSLVYSSLININDKTGYIQIKLWENEQYLIEIMYNYAKIEVMVDKEFIERSLINAICILNSVSYNDDVIENLLNNNKLVYTEEEFDFFENASTVTSNYLDYTDSSSDEVTEEEIEDTDFID